MLCKSCCHRIAFFLAVLLAFAFAPVGVNGNNIESVGTRVQRLTAWKLEKVATTCTADLRKMVIQGPSKELVLLDIEPSMLRVTRISTLFQPGDLAGPKTYPGTIKVMSEPQLPKRGDHVGFIGMSSGRRYLVMLNLNGKSAKTAMVPDTIYDGIKMKWDLLWFRLNADGSKFVGICLGKIVTPGKSGSCISLVSMGTNGAGLFFLSRPRWDGKKFYYPKTGAGKILAPIGIARETGKVFFKAEIGQSGKHGVYTCSSDGKNFKLLITATTKYSITATVSSVSSTDLVTDDGKYLVLNDNGMEHPGAITFETATGDVKAKLAHKSVGVSCDGKFSFFSDPAGFGMEFVFGGEPYVLIEPNQPNWPVVGKINNRGNSLEPSFGNITCSPFGFLGRSETDAVAVGEVYFVGIPDPPVPPTPKLVVPPVIDFGLVEGNLSLPLPIGNEAKTAIIGTATITAIESCNPFSFSGEQSADFSSIGDIPVSLNTTCMSKGFTYEAEVMVSSIAGRSTVQMIATLNDPGRLLVRLGIGRKTSWIGSRMNDLPVAPFVLDGVTMVPLRVFLDALPCDFEWETQTQLAKIGFQDKNVEIVVGKEKMLVNGQEVPMAKPAIIKDGQTFIPLRSVTEAFGGALGWYAKSQSILVNFPLPYWGREQIDISGVPVGAKVMVNYSPHGVAPTSLYHLVAGKYHVKIYAEGYETFETYVDVPPSPAKVQYFLQKIVPTKAETKVSSIPKGAYVYVDGKATATCPATIQLEPGLRTIKASLNGYPDYVMQIVALPGQKLELSFDLESLKQKKDKQVDPPYVKKTVNLEQKRREDIDLVVANHVGVPVEFRLKSPENIPPGFEDFGFTTLDGLAHETTTPKLMPGDAFKVRFSVVVSEDASPGQELRDIITIEPSGYPSWKIELPLEIILEGEAQKPPRLHFELSGDAKEGSEFTVLLKIKDAKGLTGSRFYFVYQPSKLDILSIEDGGFFSGDGTNTAFYWSEVAKGEILVTGPVRIGSLPGVDGEGVVLKIRLHAKKKGEAIFDCQSSTIYDSKSKEIEHFKPEALVVEVKEGETLP
ncbi:MAG: PEGA domain-containing protein [Caldisericales bacterium]|nr:PEGA domain-containing protein [Caldisericales bacterium]